MQLIGELVGALFMSYFHSFNFTFLFYSETAQISRKKGWRVGLGTRTIKLPFLPACFLITTFVSLKSVCVLNHNGAAATTKNLRGTKKCNYESRMLTLVIEAVDTVDGGTLVVAPEQEEVLGVFDLVCQQQADRLQRLLPSVHVVS